MAQRNADLVDIQFLISYLGRFVQISYLIGDSKDIGRGMVDLLSSKLDDEESA